MESSRVFVRGLPPSLTEDEFRKHFAVQPITDIKLIPGRRIGYVGYRTAEDAVKVVKYFNKSFIRMSRIAVELALPVADAPKLRRKLAANSYSQSAIEYTPEATENNSKKRKQDAAQDMPEDAKLAEYLDTMAQRPKQRLWADERNERVINADHFGTKEPPADDDDRSDEEYQNVPKRNKRADDLISESVSVSLEEDSAQKVTNAGVRNVNVLDLSDAREKSEATAMSDAAWFRLRTCSVHENGIDREHDAFAYSAQDNEHENSVQDLMEDTVGKAALPEYKEKLSVKVPYPDNEIDATHHTRRIFIRNLPFSISEDDLRSRFLNYKSLEEVHIPKDFRTGAGKGTAYVQFGSPADAFEALYQLDGTIFQGRLLHILPAAAKREHKLDEFALSKFPLKKQKQIKRKTEASTSTFNWNSLYMNADAVISSISDRLHVPKSHILDPTSSDAAVKQAQAETHLIQETKTYFLQNGVDLEAFKNRQRGDTAILIKNFPYGTSNEELRGHLEEHGTVTRLLMAPSGTIAIAEFAQAIHARAAFGALAYRKFKGSVLFLEKAPKDVFGGSKALQDIQLLAGESTGIVESKLSTSDLLQRNMSLEVVDTSTLFVKNLSFQTTTSRLTDTFKPVAGFLSARVKTKSDPKRPGQLLSMGFGFLEFRTGSQAQAALAAMQGYNLDGHQLVIKASHKGLDAAEESKKEDQAKKVAARSTKIVIKNLPFEASKKDLRTLFGAYGQLRSVRMPKKHDSSTRGFAFADFITPREAENALNALHDTHLLGRRLVLDFAAENPGNAEQEIEKMQRKVGLQINKVALEKLTSGGRKKFRIGNDNDEV